ELSRVTRASGSHAERARRSGFEYVSQDFHYLVGCRAPGLSFGVDFFEWVDDIVIVQGHVGLSQCGAVAGVESGVPLLVLVSETYYHHVALFDQGASANCIDLSGLVIAPELALGLAEMVSGSVTGGVFCHG